MRLSRTGLTILFILAVGMPLARAETNAIPLSLTLTAYQDGLVMVEEELEADPLELRTVIILHGNEFTGFRVMDEAGNPLDIHVNGQTAVIDSIGASMLQVTYFSKGLIVMDSDVTSLSVSSPIPVMIILPAGADFFDMSDIPMRIGVTGDHSYLEFASGDVFVYYLMGLPKLNRESVVSIENAETYITIKSSEGYTMNGARKILEESIALYSAGEYLASKNSADDALELAVKTVAFADSASVYIVEAEAALDSVIHTSNNLEEIVQATERISLAKDYFDSGYYREASAWASNALLLAQSINEVQVFIVNRQFVGKCLGISMVSLILFMVINKKLRLSQFLNTYLGVET